MTTLDRRYFLQALGLAAATFATPRVLFANAQIATQADARFVFVILRGALDGLAAVAHYGDGNYSKVRGELALPAPGNTDGALKLDGLFALNPALVTLHDRYSAGELLVFHAVASPYRERSHFDGQDLLENGTLQAHGAQDGWLNRAIAGVEGAHVRSEQLAIAFAQNVPLVLRGDARVSSWAPSKMPGVDADTLQRIADMYASDEYFASRLRSALSADAVAGESQ
jgi:uncharacterized protein (DUF1501 family)